MRQPLLLTPLLLVAVVQLGQGLSGGKMRRQVTFAEPPGEVCTTPTGQGGRCVAVTQCPSIFAILTARPIPTQQFDFLRRSICRRDTSGRPMFCCGGGGAGSLILTPQPTTPAATAPPTEPLTFPPSEAPTPPAVEGLEPFVLSTTPGVVEVTTTPSLDDMTRVETGGIAPMTSPEQPPVFALIVSPPVVGSTSGGLVPTLEECGHSNVQLHGIVGRREIKQGDWPWVAALGYSSGRGGVSFSCGGALITRRHVLTAAHCVEGQAGLRVVRLGEPDLTVTTDAQHEDYNISKRTVHEDYNKNFRNDIAILTLSRDVVFKKQQISPICLPLPSTFTNGTLEAQRPFVAGWGSVQFNQRSSNILRDVSVVVQPTDTCAKAFARFRTVTVDERVLCAGWVGGGRDACQGDSGGPLMLSGISPGRATSNYFIVGVVSLGYRCAEADYPGIYSRVSYYVPWILSKLQ